MESSKQVWRDPIKTPKRKDIHMNTKLDKNDLESNYNYPCDERERQQHIMHLVYMQTREEQEEYMQEFGIK